MLNGRRSLRPVRLRPIDAKPIRAQGPRTGRSYEFTQETPEHEVDPMDAIALLNSGLFERVG
jgi:hypothetical protein